MLNYNRYGTHIRIYTLIRRFAYKTGPIFTWEFVDILFRFVYKTKESSFREKHISVSKYVYANF